MRRSWRLTAIGIMVVGAMLAFGINPAAAESRAHVYLLRGLMNIFSLGMDTLSEQLNRRGVYATVHGYGEWQSLADRAAVDFKAGKEGPIILIGHSLGADAVMEMAAYLGRKGIPVALVVPFDGTQSFAASDNVARVLNLTQRDYAYMRRGPGFHGTLSNVDVSSDPSIDHINIDKSPRLHARVVSEVLAVVGNHHVGTPTAAKPTTVNGVSGATAPPAAGSAAKPEAAPAATPQGAPAKNRNGADAGTGTPVAEGTPIIAVPEHAGTHQSVDSPVPPQPQHKPVVSSPAARAEQVPN
jgi:alpha-beta hydrolase superfamily lysophospholipase